MGLVIGLTGGIGSGKTAASDYFASLGITIVDADVAARLVVDKDKPALSAIVQHFGASVLKPEGELNRSKLRSIIFSSEDEKKWLEQLLHPLIRDEIQIQLENSKSVYTVFVSPLLIETDQHLLTNRVLLIDAPEEQQIQRTTQRDNNTADQIKSIMANQASREVRQSNASDIIVNDSTLAHLHQKIDNLHLKYTTLANHN